MSDAILVAIITGGLSLLGIIYSSGKSASKVGQAAGGHRNQVERTDP